MLLPKMYGFKVNGEKSRVPCIQKKKVQKKPSQKRQNVRDNNRSHRQTPRESKREKDQHKHRAAAQHGRQGGVLGQPLLQLLGNLAPLRVRPPPLRTRCRTTRPAFCTTAPVAHGARGLVTPWFPVVHGSRDQVGPMQPSRRFSSA